MNEEEFYTKIYSSIQSTGLTGWYINKSHKELEKGLSHSSYSSILEVGGNIGEHIGFVAPLFDKYVLSDYRNTGFCSTNPKIKFAVENVEKLTFETETFDRVISTCLLHHLDKPVQALQEMKRVTKKGGVISISLPCDPGFAYRISKLMGPARKWKKLNESNPNFFHYTQHKNHYPAIKSYIEEVFKEDQIKIKHWPFKVPTWNMNLFSVVQIKKL